MLTSPTGLRLQIDSRLDAVGWAGVAVRAVARQILPDDSASAAELCVVEAVNNVIEHAYASQPGHLVTIELTPFAGGLLCSVIHTGSPPPIDWRQAALADPTALAVIDLPEGGFGVSLLQALTSHLTSHTEQGVTRLSFCIGAEEG